MTKGDVQISGGGGDFFEIFLHISKVRSAEIPNVAFSYFGFSFRSSGYFFDSCDYILYIISRLCGWADRTY